MTRIRLLWLFIGLLNGLAFIPWIVYARSIDMSKAGVSLWIFLSVGACIILLQAIPAAIIIIGFITSCNERR